MIVKMSAQFPCSETAGKLTSIQLGAVGAGGGGGRVSATSDARGKRAARTGVVVECWGNGALSAFKGAASPLLQNSNTPNAPRHSVRRCVERDRRSPCRGSRVRCIGADAALLVFNGTLEDQLAASVRPVGLAGWSEDGEQAPTVQSQPVDFAVVIVASCRDAPGLQLDEGVFEALFAHGFSLLSHAQIFSGTTIPFWIIRQEFSRSNKSM